MKRIGSFVLVLWAAVVLGGVALAGPFAGGGSGGGGGGSGTVTDSSCTPANGVTCTVANSTTTPAFSIGLGAITPSTVTTGTVTTSVINGTPTIATPTISGHPTIEGVTSTGATGTGNIVYSSSPTINTPTFVAPALGTPSSGTATNLTGTAASLTAGSATVLATPRAIAGHNFDGSAAITIACGDLSNGSTGCSTATGTSGATIPLLNAANTWSANQSHNSGTLILKGATSGTTTLNAAATAGATTITLPGGTTDFSATGGTSQVVKQTSSGGAFSVARLACADLSDSGAGCTGAAGATLGANTFTNNQIIQEAAGGSGLTLTGATQTTSQPVINATQTWNAAGVLFTGFKLNVTSTASTTSSLLMDLQFGGSSVFAVRRDGAILGNGAGYVGEWNATSGFKTTTGYVVVGGNLFFGSGTDAVMQRNAANTVSVLKSTTVSDFGDLRVRYYLSSGSTPTMGACGTSPSVAGTDEAMLVTVGTGGSATSCAVTFGNASTTNAPVCHAQSDTDIVAYKIVTTTTTVTVTASAAFTASSKLHILCKRWL